MTTTYRYVIRETGKRGTRAIAKKLGAHDYLGALDAAFHLSRYVEAEVEVLDNGKQILVLTVTGEVSP